MGAVFEFRGGHAGFAFKDPGEILGVFKSQPCGDLGEIQFGLPDQPFGFTDLQLCGVIG